MANNGGRVFDLILRADSGRKDEDGKPIYRRTYLGVMFENRRPNQAPYFTIRTDLLGHPIYAFERRKDENSGNGTEAPQDDVDVEKPPQ